MLEVNQFGTEYDEVYEEEISLHQVGSKWSATNILSVADSCFAKTKDFLFRGNRIQKGYVLYASTNYDICIVT